MERDVSAAVKAGAHGIVIGVRGPGYMLSHLNLVLTWLSSSSLPSSIYQPRFFRRKMYGTVLQTSVTTCRHDNRRARESRLSRVDSVPELAQEMLGVILWVIDSERQNLYE